MSDTEGDHTTFRSIYRLVFLPVDVLTISFAFLDGKDHSEHVCYNPWCVDSLSHWSLIADYFVVNFSTYLLLDRAPNAIRPTYKSIEFAIASLTFTAAVFRAEVVLLLVPLCVQLLVTGQIPFRTLLKVGLFVSILSVGECFSDLSGEVTQKNTFSLDGHRRLVFLEATTTVARVFRNLFQYSGRKEF